MGARDTLAALLAAGLRVEVTGERLRVQPAELLTDSLREAIRAHKAELLALLEEAAPPAPADDPPDQAPTDPSSTLSASARTVAGALEWLTPAAGALDAQNLAIALAWRPGEVWGALRELERAGLVRRGRDLAWRMHMRREGLALVGGAAPAAPVDPSSVVSGAVGRNGTQRDATGGEAALVWRQSVGPCA